jgi:predicted aspartyl protease
MILVNCAGVQRADIKANLQAMSQACVHQMQADRELDPIKTKVQLSRSAIEGAPPPEILADNSKPSPEEKTAIVRWAALSNGCAQEAMRYLLGLSLPPSEISTRDKLVLALRQANAQRGLLIAALYEGKLTYSEFAIQRMKVGDQLVASLSGAGPPPQATEEIVPAQLSAPASPTIPSGAGSRGSDEIMLERQGNSYVVPVSVNDLPPMGFVLDTGSDAVALPAEVVLTLWRTGTLQSSDFIGNKTYVLADGREIPSLTFRIRRLQVGQHVIDNVVASLNPALTNPLLGGSFLSRFASWKVDNQRQVLILSR